MKGEVVGDWRRPKTTEAGDRLGVDLGWSMPPATYTAHRLPGRFRYVHEPLENDEAARGDGGRSDLSRQLADRLMFSRGGAFLVTGYRGVGKTTFVHSALRTIRAGAASYALQVGKFELLDVWLNVARPIEPVALMHLLVRQLVLRLRESGGLAMLEPSLRRDLDTAFLRTTFEISGRSSRSEERSRSEALEAKWVGLEFLGKVATSYKEATTAEEALKYLPYDERAAEFDIVSMARRLAAPGADGERSRLQRLAAWLRLPGARQRARGRPPFKVVFVLDELDKLGVAQTPTGDRSPLDSILEALKTVFTSTAFSFVFIAGRDVRERWTRDVALGDSIYESVFAYDIYLPCLWDEQAELLARWFGDPGPEPAHQAPIDLRGMTLYLQYKGRGIPRRLLRELNRHVT